MEPTSTRLARLRLHASCQHKYRRVRDLVVVADAQAIAAALLLRHIIRRQLAALAVLVDLCVASAGCQSRNENREKQIN